MNDSAAMQIDVVTIFPAMLEGFLGQSIMKRAESKGAVRFRVINLRDFTDDAHRTVDDRPYGGGPGMVMKPEPFFKAVESVRTPDSHVVLMAPQGRRFAQRTAVEFAALRHLIFLCGHYEGVDYRVESALATETLSIGDYVLTNGTLAAAVVIDAVVRLLPGVLGHEDSAREESFSGGLLEYPQFTRPAEFRGMKVPGVLLGGDHAAIADWRREQAWQRTQRQRPDLITEGAERDEKQNT